MSTIESDLAQARKRYAEEHPPAPTPTPKDPPEERRLDAAGRRRILEAEVKARAARRLTDPDDAVGLLDLDTLPITEAGVVDTVAIDKAIDQLLKSKPYLAGQGVKPSVDGGARLEAPQPDRTIEERVARIKRDTGIS